MISSEQIEAEIVTILRTQCDLDDRPIGRDDRLQEDLGLDSVQLLSLVLEVENAFRIHLDESQEEPPTKLGEVIDLVALRVSEQHRDS